MTRMVDHPTAPRPGHELCEGLTSMFKAASKRLPVVSLCIVHPDGPDAVVLTHADVAGTSGHRVAPDEVSDVFQMRQGSGHIRGSQLESHPDRLVEARLLMTGMPERARESFRAREAIVVALPDSEAQAVLIVGLSTSGTPSDALIAEASRLGAEAWQLLNRTEAPGEELARLRRVAALEALLPALVEAIDIREIFERVSSIANQTLAHDFLSIGTFNDDRTKVQLYAQTSDWTFPEAMPVQFAPVLVETFTYHLIDNLLDHPFDAPPPDNDFGARSSLRVPVRVNKTVVAALNFSSRSIGEYVAGDIAVAQRIAEYVAIAMSHQQLAEASRRAAALQERETNLEMLDGLLSTLAGVLDVRDVFERVSAIAKKVLPHDLLGLPLFSKDRNSLIVYAVVGAKPTERPLPLTAMHRRLLAEPWDHIIVDDILDDPELRVTGLAPTGVRSLLRVAIRVEQQLVGFLDFGMFTTGYYQAGHALVARRIADHVAMALSHHRLAEASQRATVLAERTANLQVLDGLLSALTGVLDIREAFERVSEIAKRVLPHDAMGLPIVTDDREHIIRFATTGLPADAIPRIQPLHESVKRLLMEPWDVHIFDDIEQVREAPVEQFARLGYRSMLRVCVRLEGQMVGALVFFSRSLAAFTEADGLIGRRIADHIALVISHQRLADESRRTAALQERAANLQMLEGLLKTLTGVLDIRQVFDRVAEIAQQVLPHDAISIGEVINDGEHIRMYASQGLGRGAGPFDTPIRDRRLLTEAWDYRLMDDIAEHALYAESAGTVGGMHSVLFVPIRLEEGRLYGALTFYSKQKGLFKRDDALIAKRIADHIALALSHHRLADESRRAAALEERAANLDALDGLLNAVAGVLDVRSVFDRISQIGNTVMPHDAMTILTRSSKPGFAHMYAATGDLSHLTVHMEIPVILPRLLTDPWDVELIPDLGSDPKYANTPAMKEGMRSILIMPIRSGGQLVASVNFLSRTPNRFSRDDVPMARRITDHIGLALSHEQLAEEMRKSEELRAKTANIGLLDALLASVTDTVDLKTVLDRVADISQKVLPYDAMIVPVVVNDGARLKFHIVRTPPGVTLAETMDVPSHLRSTEWEYHIVDDMQTDPLEQSHPFAALGLRASLRIAIRVQGQLTAGVAFYSFQPGVYKEADVMIGRRIGARLAISLMREKGLEATKRADEASARASRLENRVRALTEELNARSGFHRVIGDSPTWRQALTQATQVAATETTVLLLGESGTGKEVVARFIHRASTRKNGPFVALNCAALPEQLLESELFGYERGAFTGAMNARAGKIEQAAGGVLFLDEVGEMSPTVQAKFLRVLQEREFQRLGGSKTLTADCRVIAATNRDPKLAMEKGAFREDLYYRLSVFEISLPPLRDRRDDILLLVENFLSDLAKNIGRPAGGLSEDAKDRLLAYHWPGNVRELRNAIERAVILAEGGLITSDHLPIAVGQSKPVPAAIPATAPEGDAVLLPAGMKLETLERDLLNKAMAQAKNNKSQAAKLLGVPRGQFYSLLKRHGLTDAKR